ncbi:hypothetical protein EHV15_21585 [Paenibacillus oralis]|uniref:Glyoxalase/fosfomycin resistance/dioxygenase domain-containing protein n=1 Tax=Paenibacillus oralis TaxID=2490856 RepID=A0A3P3U4N8_9BACL|nr:hypothetical protein [Paenibacillus oralis]RRJ65215.1 hypothetical protein EHV15_21585 [Paenibacillus oralis]
MIIRQLKLKTNKFSEMKSFYRDVLQFPILEETNSSFSVAAGETVVIYESIDLHTFYHYARISFVSMAMRAGPLN